MKIAVREELATFFNPHQPDGKRFLDVTQIPRICEDLRSITKDVKLLKRIVYGAIAVILAAFIKSLIKF
jgi:hypothetical protein